MFSLRWPAYICKFIGTKESVCIRKESNCQRTGLGHQHDRRFIVLGHQYGRRDVMWKHSIEWKHACIINVWGYMEILPSWKISHGLCLRIYLRSVPNLIYSVGAFFVLFSFANMLINYLEENSPARARQVRRKIEFAGKLLRIRRWRKKRDRCWPPICAQSQTSIRTSRGTEE